MKFTEWLLKNNKQMTPYMWTMAHALNDGEEKLFTFQRNHSRAMIVTWYRNYLRERQ